MKPLSALQEAFVEAKVNGLPNRKAALQAGYSPSGASVQASILMTNPRITAAIDERKKKLGKSAVKQVASGKAKLLKPHYESPLALYLDLMNNPEAPDGLRIEAAKQALPFIDAKLTPKGKRASAKDEAREAAKTSKFGVGRKPGLRVVS